LIFIVKSYTRIAPVHKFNAQKSPDHLGFAGQKNANFNPFYRPKRGQKGSIFRPKKRYLLKKNEFFEKFNFYCKHEQKNGKKRANL